MINEKHPRNHVSHHTPHPPHAKPTPPHERRTEVHLAFGDKDNDVLRDIFGDEDSAAAAVSIVYDAPAEVQILAFQAVEMVSCFRKPEEDFSVPDVNEDGFDFPVLGGLENQARWTCPALDESAYTLFNKVYGDTGAGFYEVLSNAPYEIAVVARILAYLKEKAGGMNYGQH